MTGVISHLVEFALGLPGAFLQQQGDWSLQFNPVWPATPLVDAGPANWIVAAAAGAALLAVVLRPPAPGTLGPVARRIFAPVARFLPATFGRALRPLGIVTLYALLLAQLHGGLAWNGVLGGTALLLVYHAYLHDGWTGAARWALGGLRALAFALVLFLLNRPVVALGQVRVEPSTLAVLIDDSSSMRVPDVGPATAPLSRLGAVQDLFAAHGGELLRTLAMTHDLRVYRFDRDAQPVADMATPPAGSTAPADATVATTAALKAIARLTPDGDSTQVLPSILTVLQDLRARHVAGVVLLTDGRDTPARDIGGGLDALRDFGVKVFPVAVGSDQQPRNIQVQGMQVDDVAFRGDVVNVRATVRATGYEPNHAVRVVLKDGKTGAPLPDVDGHPAERTIHVADDRPVVVELQWKTADTGARDVAVEAVPQPGEIDPSDNRRDAAVSVVDAKVNVLLVDGYPRWEYRYLRNALLRDKTMAVSCLLASSGPGFLPDGNKPLPSASANLPGHFPTTIEQLMEYDVLILGDVDPQYFSDAQLQLINEFVSRGGGFEMVAGNRFAPRAYRDTPIEPVLPVSIPPSDAAMAIPVVSSSSGFRPVVTPAGAATGIFRFFADPAQNGRYLTTDLRPIFWYARGITPKPGVGEVLAERPADPGSGGHPAPILVAGRFGGRTLFSAIDESWRWRFYTGESVFDTYWVQQVRYLARGRKVGQRRLSLSADQPAYELGGQVRLTLDVVDPALLRQLPEHIRATVDDRNGKPTRVVDLVRQEGAGDGRYVASFVPDRVGKFTVHMPAALVGGEATEAPLDVTLPQMELNDPRVDRVQLSRLASETLGRPIEWADAAAEMERIPSAAKRVPVVTSRPLWNAPLTMALFVLLLGSEWAGRKIYGML
jgi:hypothetical protein